MHAGRVALVREIGIAALRVASSSAQHSELDRVLDALSPGERLHLIRDLIVQSAAGEVPRERVLDYVGGSRYVAGLPASAERLDLLVMVSLLLTDAQGRVVQQASREIGELVADPSSQGGSQVWSALLSDSRLHIAELREDHGNEVESQRMQYERRLEEMRLEQERLTRRVEGLRSQIAEGREESRLDIRQDMLMEIAVTLQSFHQQEDTAGTLVHDIKASLVRALRAGGAEEFGSIGDTVPYDPRFHEAKNPTASGSPVRVYAPGALVRGRLTGDRVLIKARVAQPGEVNKCK